VKGGGGPCAHAAATFRWPIGASRYTGQRKKEGTSNADLTFHPDRATMGFRDSFGNKKSKASALTDVRMPRPIMIEDMAELTVWDTAAGIRDREAHRIFRGHCGYANLASFFGKFNRVSNQIGDDLQNARSVTLNGRRLICEPHFQLQ
jgi:hypothetical protein